MSHEFTRALRRVSRASLRGESHVNSDRQRKKRAAEMTPAALMFGSGGGDSTEASHPRGGSSCGCRGRHRTWGSVAAGEGFEFPAPGYERGAGSLDFSNVLGMLRGEVGKMIELDRARWNKSPTAAPTHRRAYRGGPSA